MNETENIQMIFKQMKDNSNLVGNFELANEGAAITWNLFDGYTVTIDMDYIEIDKLLFGKHLSEVTHWHPDDDLYDNICKLGTKGNVTVIHKSVLGERVLYSGVKSKCKYKRRWLFGRFIYLYAE